MNQTTCKRYFSLCVAVLALCGVFWGVWGQAPIAPIRDWGLYYFPAGAAVLRGENPYGVEGFVSPPYFLVVLVPLALVGGGVGGALWLLGIVGLFAVGIRRAGAGVWDGAGLLLNPLVLLSLWWGTPDLGLAGFVLLVGVEWGMLAAVLKPQLGVGLFYGFARSRLQHETHAGVFFATQLLIFGAVLAYIWWGHWWDGAAAMPGVAWNRALPWYFGWPLGALCLWYSRGVDQRWLMVASLCCSPFVGIYSWSLVALLFLGKPRAMWLLTLGLWAWIGVNALLFGA